ncbi:BTB/POZ domain and ankyrin repeat-containing protein NPR1-like isoform X2 [Mangifera indica]|uniref:BTB/POZ domain and ankyrin repeat-containing protein NPR1-like isoform X2 n=1 Tax=Mangifera indica TaxID=29780 RepID=UPI001CFB0CA1|nr:BTB/POZ domain and ankyrin repeat-containing protein NPR1-like isoform X2 [Mangifera indica]
MDDVNELSSSMSFASSSILSNGSSSSDTSPEHGLNLEILSLSRLSGSLEKLLLDSDYDYTDAEIVVEGISVGVHRCILSARSQFFHELFKKGNDASVSEGKPKYLMSELVPLGKVGYEAFNVFLNYLYTGKLKQSPPEVSTCVDESCAHDACRPAINYALELMYASATFQMKELVLLSQRRLLNFVEKAFVEDVIPILVAAFHCQLNPLCTCCIQRLIRSDLDNVCLEKELPAEVFHEIKLIRSKPQGDSEQDAMELDPMHKRIRSIHKALDSDDVELVKLLLNESNITLDRAYALHYATAYCDPKIVREVLSLGLADLNLRNCRGHTVLHVAARRKEPSILAALLTKGVSASETTLDGQTAVAICRRLTRPKDYHENTEQGQECNKDRICIVVLEREIRRNSVSGNVSVSSQVMADDLHMKLDYLENRVAFARLLFPAEARLAMEVGDAHSTSVYAGLSASKSKGSSGNLIEVNLNETPSVQARRMQKRFLALLKTVETGQDYFPHCSEVLDKFLDDDFINIPDAFLLEKGTPEEQKIKKMRYMELKDDVQKAFYKDMAEKNQSGLSSSSSSSSPAKAGVKRKVRKK